jgi:hypothetical protein
MIIGFTKIQACLLLVIISTAASAQKAKVGYDKSVDFSKFKTYTWTEPATPPTRPLLYASVVGWIEQGLKSKGLASVAGNGDLLLIPAGGMEFGLNIAAGTPIIPNRGGPQLAMDASMWVGVGGPSNLMTPYVPEGRLVLYFVERSTNKVIWTGTVTEKLDIENKNKSLERIGNGIAKLLKQFPPNKK